MIASFELHVLMQATLWFIFLIALFSLLAEWYANNKGQAVWRKSMWTDGVYWFLTPIFYGRLSQWLLLGIITIGFTDTLERQQFFIHGYGMLVRAPLWLQFILVLLLTDILQYWSHRLFHGRRLWKFHSIHHSSEEVDWLSAWRFHPVNLLFHSTLVSIVVFALGFSPVVYLFMAQFNILYSALVHANLRWSFGPLAYAFASPLFHRWHHTLAEEGGEKNFAPTFPFLDIIFGTFYMPKGKQPEKFGVNEKVPSDFLGQMAYPFRKKY